MYIILQKLISKNMKIDVRKYVIKTKMTPMMAVVTFGNRFGRKHFNQTLCINYYLNYLNIVSVNKMQEESN